MNIHTLLIVAALAFLLGTVNGSMIDNAEPSTGFHTFLAIVAGTILLSYVVIAVLKTFF